MALFGATRAPGWSSGKVGDGLMTCSLGLSGRTAQEGRYVMVMLCLDLRSQHLCFRSRGLLGRT